MKTAGMLMWIIGGALFAYAALGFDPTVELEGGFGTRIPNIGLLQDQGFLGIGGALLFLAGIIFHAAGEIVEALQTKSAPASGPVAIAPTGIANGSDETDAELMARHGITLEGDKYAFGQYKYDRLGDAGAYAKKTTR